MLKNNTPSPERPDSEPACFLGRHGAVARQKNYNNLRLKSCSKCIFVFMFKKTLWTIGTLGIVASLFISSCKEEPPVGLFISKVEPLLDTFYMASTPAAAQDKHVLIFYITGVRCSNCPKAAEVAKSILAANNGKVSAIALYGDIPGLDQLVKPWEGYPVLNTSDALQLITSLGSPNSLPTGCVDQIEDAGNRMIPITRWSNLATTRLGLSTAINIDIEANYDPTTEAITVKTKSTFTSDGTSQYLVYVGLTENEIESKQSENRVTSGHVDDYIHEHVLRTLMTTASGSEILGTTLAQTVVEKHFRTTKAANWKVANMHALAWVVNKATKEVLNVREISIK